MRSTVTHRPPPSWSLPDLLQEWVAAGLITSEQSQSIRRHEAEPHEGRASLTPTPPPAAGPSLVVEALGYLGGVVMLVGAGILVSLYWTDLATPVRLALIAATAAVLIGAGFAVPDRLGDAAGRLRAVLWAGGVAATAGFLGVFSVDVLDRPNYHMLVIIGPATAVVAAVLWRLRPTWLQQLALFAALMIAADGTALELSSRGSPWGGAAMWALGTVWAVVAYADRLQPRLTGVAFGALGAVVGSLVMDNDLGIALGLATAAAMVALALWERSLPWLGVAAISLLYTTPPAANAWFPGRLSAALTFLVTGGLLVGAAIWVARRRDA